MQNSAIVSQLAFLNLGYNVRKNKILSFGRKKHKNFRKDKYEDKFRNLNVNFLSFKYLSFKFAKTECLLRQNKISACMELATTTKII